MVSTRFLGERLLALELVTPVRVSRSHHRNRYPEILVAVTTKFCFSYHGATGHEPWWVLAS